MFKLTHSILQSFVIYFTMVTGAFAAETAPRAKVTNETQQEQQQSVAQNEEGLGMNVFGGKDLPQVLYIVPWKAPNVLATDKPESQLLQTVFSPIDPEVFERSVRFRERLTKSGSATDQ